MKKVLSFVLVLVIAFSMCACGQSAEVTAFEAAVSAIPKELEYDSWETISAAKVAYEELTEKDIEKVDASALESAIDTYLALPAVAECVYLKKQLPNNETMKIYGDIHFYDIKTEANEFSCTCLVIDFVNGYGVYGGQTPCEVLAYADGSYRVTLKGSSGFYGLDSVTTYCTLEQLAEMGITLSVIPGNYVAAALGCEYIA